jgi:hypothetical protein
MSRANGEVAQTKEQLEVANKRLQVQIAEATAAKRAAETAAETARKATADATAAKATALQLLKDKEAEVARLQAEKKKIYDGTLLPK